VAGGGLGLVVVIIAALAFGVDPTALLQAGGQLGTAPAAPSGQGAVGTPDDALGQFVAVVLGDTEAAWSQVFAASGHDYPEPTLVLFDGAVRSACGTTSSAVGPFYCPGDRKVYLDLAFFRQLRDQLGAPGDFAQAYVIAHEVGHHVQNLTGAMQGFSGYGESGPNSRAVRMELQADCYAGIWAHYSQQAGYVEAGDLREALNAAAAIGDDNLQARSQGVVVPESFTHGTSEQRARWFRRGLETGDPAACDTGSGAL
jgi:predicted metalloprotease